MFGQEHPERQDGETFIGIFGEEAFGLMSWETKRTGTPIMDDPQRKRYPVFVRAEEIKQRADARGRIAP